MAGVPAGTGEAAGQIPAQSLRGSAVDHYARSDELEPDNDWTLTTVGPGAAAAGTAERRPKTSSGKRSA